MKWTSSLSPLQTTLIAVDIGNSSLRAGQFNTQAMTLAVAPNEVRQWQADIESFEELLAWLPQEPATWSISSVNRPVEKRLSEWRRKNRGNDTYYVLEHTDIPLEIELDRPDHIGMDRLAAAMAANTMRRENRAMIIVDAGSAITVDVLSPYGSFLGGAILPGVSMAAEALHHRTDQLPDVERDGPVLPLDKLTVPPTKASVGAVSNREGPPPVIGKSTDAAIRSGLVWGAVGALKLLIREMGALFDESPDVVFAGGDAVLLAPMIEVMPATYPDLVLSGIALIEHQRKRESDSE